MRILVIEDEVKLANAVKRALELQNYAVDAAYDGTSGLDLAIGEEFDLILLDVWMSGEDGRNVCRLLKSQQQTKDIPIIMISATSYIEESTREAGAEDFIPKPFQMNVLLDRVGQYI